MRHGRTLVPVATLTLAFVAGACQLLALDAHEITADPDADAIDAHASSDVADAAGLNDASDAPNVNDGGSDGMVDAALDAPLFCNAHADAAFCDDFETVPFGGRWYQTFVRDGSVIDATHPGASSPTALYTYVPGLGATELASLRAKTLLVVRTDAGVSTIGSVTLELDFRVDAFPPTNEVVVVATLAPNGVFGDFVRFGVKGGGNVYLEDVSTSAIATRLSSSSSVALGAWTHLSIELSSMTASSSTAKVSINGGAPIITGTVNVSAPAPDDAGDIQAGIVFQSVPTSGGTPVLIDNVLVTARP